MKQSSDSRASNFTFRASEKEKELIYYLADFYGMSASGVLRMLIHNQITLIDRLEERLKIRRAYIDENRSEREKRKKAETAKL